jgi:hypothetical protein
MYDEVVAAWGRVSIEEGYRRCCVDLRQDRTAQSTMQLGATAAPVDKTPDSFDLSAAVPKLPEKSYDRNGNLFVSPQFKFKIQVQFLKVPGIEIRTIQRSYFAM